MTFDTYAQPASFCPSGASEMSQISGRVVIALVLSIENRININRNGAVAGPSRCECSMRQLRRL
ncbi:hypothetical protein SMB554_18780 (plasmid) [Sinorhizobium meliloti]|nr:hypothetical protein SMB554_18780 [Sinorhizobium meliloti]